MNVGCPDDDGEASSGRRCAGRHDGPAPPSRFPPIRDVVDLSRYIRNFATESFAAGEVIFSQGGEGASMYIIVDGDVDVAYDEQRSVRLGAGESLGEMSLIDKRPRSATVTAATDVTLAPISQGLVPRARPRHALLRPRGDAVPVGPVAPRQPDAGHGRMRPTKVVGGAAVACAACSPRATRDLSRRAVVSVARGSGGGAPGCLAPRRGPRA